MSHPSLRSTLVPLASGLAAVIAVCGLCGATPALGAAWSGGTPAAGAGSAGGTSRAASVRAQEWWLTSLHVTQAWSTTQGSGVTVAVLGTGVATSHPDLAGSVTTGPDYTGSGRTPGSAFWGVNGTGVAGLIAGHGHGAGDAAGLIGVAPAAKILSVRVNLEFNDPLNSDAAVTRRLPAAIASGIRYAVGHGARVIDLPLDPGTFGLTGHGDPAAAGGSAAERAAVAAALRQGVILVAPAGDDGQGPGAVNYPAAYPGVIAVGAVGRNGRLAAFSSRRSYVTLTAPGVDLVTATPPGGYQQVSSTSTASGLVAGVAALIVSRFPQLSAAQVTQALTRSTLATTAATPPTAGGVVTGRAAAPGTGYGTVNAARAIELAAAMNSAGQVRQTATPTATPPKPLRAAASPHQANASSMAGSLVRDVVAVLGVLIVLLIGLLLIMNSRRRRAEAAARARSGQTPGVHAHRRPDRAAGSGPQSGRPGSGPQSGSPGSGPESRRSGSGPESRRSGSGPESGRPGARRASGAALPGVAVSPGAAVSRGGTAPPGAAARPAPPQPTAPASSGWPAPGGWQGSSIIGEIAHSSPPSSGPAMAPAPKPPSSRGSRDAASQRESANPAGPPWAPAAEPGRDLGPLPMATANWFSPEPGPGIRVPGDMSVPAAPATAPAIDPAPSALDTPVPPPAEDFPPSPPPGDFPPSPPPGDFRASPPPRDFRASPSPRDFPPSPPPRDFPAPPPASEFPADRPPASEFPARPPADFQGPPAGYGFTLGPAGLGATAPQRALGFPGRAERDSSGPATVPGFPVVGSIPDFARPAASGTPGGAASSPDSGATDSSDRGAATGSEDLTQRDMGFAAAPVATDFPSPVKPAVPPGGGAGSGPAGDSASVWDLAATDVFPAAPPEPGNDDAPGASES